MTAQVRFFPKKIVEPGVTAQMERSKSNDVRVILGVSIGHMLMCVMCSISCISLLQNEAVFSCLQVETFFSFVFLSFHISMQKVEKLELQRCVNVTGLAFTSISC